MRKILSLVVAVIVATAMSTSAFADTPDSIEELEMPAIIASETVEMSDGSYYVTSIEESALAAETSAPNDALQLAPAAASSTSTKTASKTTAYYSSSGVLLWYVKVTGTFTYDGTTSACTSSTVTAASESTAWKISSKSASKSGNQATAKATAKQYAGLSVILTVSKTVTLTCSKTGVLS
jgi:hypothetical protein